jgi:predicted DNA-binding transcriptional regulator AlpA
VTIHQIDRHRRDGDRQFHPDDNHVLTFRQWCETCGFSVATGRRLINAGDSPPIIQLSVRRIGIAVGANRAWLASRVRKSVTA